MHKNSKSIRISTEQSAKIIRCGMDEAEFRHAIEKATAGATKTVADK